MLLKPKWFKILPSHLRPDERRTVALEKLRSRFEVSHEKLAIYIQRAVPTPGKVLRLMLEQLRSKFPESSEKDLWKKVVSFRAITSEADGLQGLSEERISEDFKNIESFQKLCDYVCFVEGYKEPVAGLFAVEIGKAINTILDQVADGVEGDIQKQEKEESLLDKVAEVEFKNLREAALATTKGNRYAVQGKLDWAVEEFNKATRLKTDYSPAYISLGVAYQKQSMYKESIQILERAPTEAKLNGKVVANFHVQILNALAVSHYLMGNRDSAIKYLDEALAATKSSGYYKEMGLAGIIDRDEEDDRELIEGIKELLEELKKEDEV